MLRGTLVMWNDLKGFGFVRPDDGGEDHFVHISAFKRGPSRRPEIGDHLLFRSAELPGKKRVSYALIEGVEYPEAPPPSRPPLLASQPRSLRLKLLVLMPLVFSSYLFWRTGNPLPFFSYAIFSILTMMLYGADKSHAATRRWRVPESYLHVLAVFGGWPGALLAQHDFRHKTRKSVYLLILRGIIILHFLGWAVYFYFHFRSLF